ncbi:MAG: hypothetical protein ACRECR_06355 [Thermoplasmata archaeon]
MRRPVLLSGLVLVAAGLLLAGVAAFPSPGQSAYIPSAGSHFILQDDAPFDLLFPHVQFFLGWAGSETATNLSIFRCGSDPACLSPAAEPVASGQGMSGNLSFWGSANAYYLVVPEDGAVTISVSCSGPWLGATPGVVLLLAGVGLGAVGLTGGSRPAGPPEPGPSDPAPGAPVDDSEAGPPRRRRSREA